jgi:hypothetical protein
MEMTMDDLFALAAAKEAQGCQRQMLRTAFGSTIAAALSDPTVIQVMVNPDGKLWIERATEERRETGERIGQAEAGRIICLIATHVRREVHSDALIGAEIPRPVPGDCKPNEKVTDWLIKIELSQDDFFATGTSRGRSGQLTTCTRMPLPIFLG